MELLLASPVPLISGAVFIALFIGVFFYELRSQKRERAAPPAVHISPQVMRASTPPVPQSPPQVSPPQSVGLKPKRGNMGVVLAFSLTLFLLGAVGVSVYLVGQQQRVFNFAKESLPSVPPSSPEPTRPSGLLAQTLSTVPTRSAIAPSASPTITTGVASASATVTCLELTASPNTGVAPLSVTFTGQGTAAGGAVTGMQFVFGEGQEKVIERTFDTGTTARQQVIYTYRESGIYRASLRVRGPGGTSSDTPPSCVATVTVNTLNPTTSQLSQLPKTGSASATPFAVPQIPSAGSVTPTLIFMIGGIVLVGLSALAIIF